MSATPRTATRSTAPTLTPRGVRLVTAVVFATASVAVLVWGVGPVVLTVGAVYAAKRAGVARIIPDQRTALRGLSWGAAGVALLVALSNPVAPGGAALGVALSAALGTHLYLTRHAVRGGRRTR